MQKEVEKKPEASESRRDAVEVPQYAIVSNTNLVLVEKMVNEKIVQGYRPLGGVSISPSGFIYQALVYEA